ETPAPEEAPAAETAAAEDPAPEAAPAAETAAEDAEGTEPFAGSGGAGDPYLLQTSADLAKLSELVAGGESFSGKTFLMTEDLTLPAGWTPVGALAPGAENGAEGKNILPFSGTFDGGGHLLTVPSGGLPLFGYVRNADVRDLSVYGERIAADGLVANYVVDYGSSGEYAGETMKVVSFENVTLKSGTQTLRSGFIGGMDHPERTSMYGQTSSQNEVYFTGCTVEAGVTVGYDRSQSGIGSFAGEFNGTMKDCRSSADVYGADKVGGLIGVKSSSMGLFTVADSGFHGTVTATGSWAGGIVGSGYNHETAPNTRCVCIENCSCDGTVTGGAYVGGIFGGEGGLWQAWDNGIGEIRSNSFTGKVSGTESVGAVIGYYRSLNRYTMIENNSYVSDCGADRGIGTVLYVDSSIYADGKIRALGWVDGVYCFDSSEDDMKRIRNDLNPGSSFFNIAKADHNRTDDPLGADAEALCYPVAPQDPDDPGAPDEPEELRTVKLAISGDYKTKYTVGDALDTGGMVFTVTWSDGSETQPPASDITFTGFDTSEPGNRTVTAKYGTVSAVFTVTVDPKSDRIRVTVAVYGDSRHDSDADGRVHGLAMGGLTTWVAASSWEADASETVWDVLQRVFAASGITARINTGSGSVYVAGLTYRGVSLSEFDNGSNSGWMYTVNGSHPQLGVSQRYVKNGDSIVFHYTDDYTKEQGSEGYDNDKDKEDAAAQNVEALIRAIGSPVTEASRTAVEKARKAYDALSYAQKSKVGNYGVLTAAEQALKDLKKAADEKAAEEVRKLIDALPAETAEKDRKSVERAREAYDALTEDQKALVTNYSRLTEAERQLAEAEATEKDRKAAEEVKGLIDAIAKAIPEDTERAVADARAAYDALTDLQKKLVDNYEDLVKAEKALEAVKAAEKYRGVYETTGDYIASLGTPVTGTVGGEWMVIGLTRSGRPLEDPDAYLASAAQYIGENIDEQGRLHRAKSSDNSRMIITLTALGQDPRNFAGHDLLAGLTDMDYVKKQGINGPTWALIALDSGNYEVPEDPSAVDPVTREKLIACLLDAQLEDGGWALSGSMADSDMTGMVLQALAPYYGKDDAVTEAVDRALDTVSRMQNADGTFSTFGGDGGMLPTSESISQILVALSALGIDAGKDERFAKNGVSVLDALCSFFVDGGGFRHVADGERDGMATEQAYYALTAYYRMLEGKTALYDMTDILPETPAAPADEEPAAADGEKVPDAAEDEPSYEDAPTAADAAAPAGEKKSAAFLAWGIPAVAAVGAAAFLIDRKRRASKKQ
ncbi:MAG: bacterial Ig-like domain-containing protein, partial [Oscillospiraceae bacterium]|nr:bacterial Ig-like domain-containing protein [Oscillospiraceae bacterium]